MSKVFYLLTMMRPANVLTAIADIFAGVAIAGYFSNGPIYWEPVAWLAFSSACLYAAGVVFNDVFDLELDAKERPERPLPSGKIAKSTAVLVGLILLLVAFVAAFAVHFQAGIIAFCVALAALFYDKTAKHHVFWGPLFMGVCRGLNLLLGMSILSADSIPVLWPICFLPILFIFAITLSAQGEVHGKNRQSLILALLLDLTVAAVLCLLAYFKLMDFWSMCPFLLLWLGMNLYAKVQAIRVNTPTNIRLAIKFGVLSLIPLDALYVAGFADLTLGSVVLLLLPMSIFLAKKFAVT
ncbi:UbiA-like protein EboC [Marinilongibacter aquaticus]|uniref:UbiA-like protein EboC n=1 Tax=Marinilongibacter aquaticus TaxID=2975157 RepID=UPI0021BD126E|nr:UbiA-like protein EboC [Marinilongibacter aquaticus]UBM58501.1 UbiA-like protein EboC [Marinilongibacter aquaticus]